MRADTDAGPAEKGSIMRKFAITTTAAAALAATTLGMAGAAAAAPTGAASAGDTVNSLQAQGYNVQINGTTNGMRLSACNVIGVHGLSNSNTDPAGNRIDKTEFTTVYVDISCPSSND